MKIAILGSSPIALEAALRFHLHGAAVTYYVGQDDLGFFTSPEFAADAFTSDLGLSVLKEIERTYTSSSFTWDNWKDNYEAPLLSYLKVHQEVRTDEVVSVTKRFLAPKEEIPGRSRFLDLFRVIYHVNPRDFIEEQKDSNPETYKRLTEEFVNSLASTIEMYQDYDLVLDLRNDLARASAAASGRALGENRPTDKVSYALDALKNATGLKPTADLRELAVIGSDALSAEVLLKLSHWLKDPGSRMFVITTEEEPFERFLKSADTKTKEQLIDLFRHMEEEFDKEVNEFTKKLHDWQELDDFVQVKIPKPAEPIPRLNYFSGHNVTAIDELIDKKRMFITLEKPEFRHGKKHPENNHVELKTVGVDHILVTHGKKNSQVVQVDHIEPGFFTFIPTRVNVKNAWNGDLEKIKGIEDEVFKLFSPRDSH